MKRLIFLTGRPGVGKTTVLLRAVDELKARGVRVGGMVSREVRRAGVRVGFEIVDIATGRRGWLAHVNQPTGPKVGKYRVNLQDLNGVGASSILNAIGNADVIVIDEVGPMELYSREFKDAVRAAMESGKALLGTIHFRARDPLITSIKAREDSKIIEVTRENRGRLHVAIVNEVLRLLEGRAEPSG